MPPVHKWPTLMYKWPRYANSRTIVFHVVKTRIKGLFGIKILNSLF